MQTLQFACPTTKWCRDGVPKALYSYIGTPQRIATHRAGRRHGGANGLRVTGESMEQWLEFAGNHAMLSGGFVVVLGLLIWTEISRRTRGFKEIGPAEAVPMINSGETVVVDISPAAEFNQGHIVGARNYTASRLTKPDKELEKLKGASVLVVCKNGQTALPAAASLVKLGAARVAVLKGGMTQWKSDNYPVTKK
jgi:rhodanese-related sulfurtransferase